MPLKLNRTLYTVNADLNTKASVDSPALEGTPTAPTPSVGDNSTKLATTGFVAAAAGNLLRITSFTSSGTWTKQADVARILVYVVGGGGGGGPMPGDGSPATRAISQPGGGGGFSQKLLLSSSLSNTVSVTIGAGGSPAGTGGTSSFGAFCSATGGSGGPNARVDLTTTFGAVGGSGSGGDLNFNGYRGNKGYATGEMAGDGGGSYLFPFGGGFGRIASQGLPNGSGPGANGLTNTGGGGGGGLTSGALAVAGSSGGSGIVIIYEYGY